MYDKREYTAFCKPKSFVWGMYHIRKSMGECFYTLMVNNISKEK